MDSTASLAVNRNDDLIPITDTTRLLSVPPILNNSTTLLRRLPTSDEGKTTYLAIPSPVYTSDKNLDDNEGGRDQFLKSVGIKDYEDDEAGLCRSKGHKDMEFTLVIVSDNDSISRSAVMTEDLDNEEPKGSEDDAHDEYISNKMFHLQHGFKKEEFAQAIQSSENTINPVQRLRLIRRSHTCNFMLLVEQLNAMRTAAAMLQFEHAAVLDLAAEKCERVFMRHQDFDQILESEPSQAHAIRALHTLVKTCCQDTTELIQDWAMVYHTLYELTQRITSLSAGAHPSKASAQRRFLFSKKPAEMTTPEIPGEILQHQKNVCNNWAAQMKAFEQLSHACWAFVDQATEFAVIDEIEAVSRYCGDEINQIFLKSQATFLNTKQLSHLHFHIDYTNFNKTLPKENALTTAEERKAHPLRPLFTRDMIGQHRLVREGKLKEFVSPFAASAGSSKRNAKAPAPKEYQLIVTSDTIYLCEIVMANGAEDNGRNSKKRRPKKLSDKRYRLAHEPVLVIDSQISSTPDIVHPPLVQKNMVMVCFYNQTSYILQAECSEERDAWVECARQLNIEQPKPTDACREQDENAEIQRSMSLASFYTIGKSIINKNSLFKRLKSKRRQGNRLAEGMGPIPEIDPDQLTRTEEEEKARRMQLGQTSVWEVRRLPLDLGVIPPLEHPIPFRKSHLYDTNVKIVDLTTGKMAPGEFGMGVEDRAAYFRDECALFAVLRPARLIPFNEIDRQRDDFFLCCKRLHKGEIMYVEPPYITDFYARSWLHPDMHIKFDVESRSVMIAKMYKIICSTSEIVMEFQKYHAWLMKDARISPDNTFLCMDYRSHPLRIAKRIERAITSSSVATDMRILEAGRKYTELGECNIEFRRMSNAPDALSIGFYNSVTKRDMAIGVMVFDKSKVKATASSLGLDALSALGASNGVVRVSSTEMSLTLWQTDARTRPTFVKGQRIFETVKSKSLDMFKITGQREALDELEGFMRVKNGTDCKAREIRETLKLVKIAFHNEVLDAPLEEEEKREGEKEKEEQKEQHEITEQAHKEKQEQAILGQGHFSTSILGRRPDGYLETVLEEEEEEEDEEQDHGNLEMSDDAIKAGSTDTFRFKSRSALLFVEGHQMEQDTAQESSVKIPSVFLPVIETSSFIDLVTASVMGELLGKKGGSAEDEEEAMKTLIGEVSQFRTKTTSATAVMICSPSLTAIKNTDAAVNTEDASSSSSGEEAHTPEPTSELETRVNMVKTAVLHSSINTGKETHFQVNEHGVIRATRYVHRMAVAADGAVATNINDDIVPGIDMEHHMPVKDLTKRWEEIYRLGM
ncbi:hypothetical protein BC939DRAFT_11972 [Gamsiella multidivaricata]|uniref:uncharacterized protein n=1 Tax=Gamsiella multidivaricata TaxID=101098 RepID=UPI00221E6F72|nr:uncharacterized protein BC939DRAFT_11972 [Gamsiella multidivaricata]KAI7829587.1 hypothetical protein BC939DRAFT_11972 [Gamsiella multidivaricata]